MGDGRQRLAQLTARADAELDEYLAQVPFDGTGRQEQLGGDLRVRQAVAGQPRDECFLRRELVRGLDGALVYGLAGGDQLPAGALGERLHANRLEHVVGRPQLRARIAGPALAAQPLPVQQVRAGQIRAELGAAEAASRTGDTALVRAALEWLSERTRVTPTEWALGIEARVRALLSGGEAADRLYRESISRLGRTRIRVELARSHLLYGEWQRRERRRADAREQLRTAHHMLDVMGIEAFAERARRELLATGETARKRTVETSVELTAQEAQVARLARDGLSNPEIGARLFISPRTVKYHLAKVFTKLDISSRSQLHRALPADPDTARPR